MANTGYTNFSTPVPQPAQVEQVTVNPQPSGIKPREKYKWLIYKLGITEVVIGSVCILLWLVSIIMAVTAPPYCYDYGSGPSCYPISFDFTYVSSGIWCPIVLIVSGALAIRVKTRPTVAMYNANMTMSIVSSVMMGTMVVLSGVTAGSYETYKYRAMKVPHTLLAVVGFSAVIICIVHSAFCCAGACCRHRGSHGAVVYTAPPQQYVQLPNGQLMLVQAQPMLQQNYPTMMTAPVNFQPSVAVPMMQPTAGVYPTAGIPFAGMPDQPAGAQAPMPQPATAQAKQQEAEAQEYSTSPPGYDA